MPLKKLNFTKLIEIPNGSNYNFSKYVQNNCNHLMPTDYCTDCELKNIHICPSNANLQLRNISHGAHSNDFFEAFQAAGTPVNTAGWNDAGVMFVMENPSNDKGIYSTVPITKNGVTYNKRPAKEWYWIHCPLNSQNYGYPQFFIGGKYGDFVASAIVTFKLANAYMTNLVKCGMNDETGDNFQSTDKCNPSCIDNCYKNFLEQEIDIMKPKVIFAFGKRVVNVLQQKLGSSIVIVELPHPARLIEYGYFNVLYFCIIAKTLETTGVITWDFYHELMDKFLYNGVLPSNRQTYNGYVS